MCRASRAWIRSAYRSRSSSVHSAAPVSIVPAASPLIVPRQLLELDPEEAAALRHARRVDRERLPGDDRRLGRQQPALGLVHGARDAVETRRHVDDRGSRESLVSVPARRLGERVVDLHLGPAVAEAARTVAHRAGHVHIGEQTLVELGRRHARDDRLLRLDRLAVGEPHADRAARAHKHALDVAVGLADSAVVADQLHERVGELRAAAARHGHPALLHRDRDHLRHEARRRLVGAEAGVQHPRCEQRRAPAPRRTSSRASRGSTAGPRRGTRARPRGRAAASPSRRARDPPTTTARCRGRRRRGRRWGRSARARPATPVRAPACSPQPCGGGRRRRRPGTPSPSAAPC